VDSDADAAEIEGVADEARVVEDAKTMRKSGPPSPNSAV